jgi:hypothetical protein
MQIQIKFNVDKTKVVTAPVANVRHTARIPLRSRLKSPHPRPFPHSGGRGKTPSPSLRWRGEGVGENVTSQMTSSGSRREFVLVPWSAWYPGDWTRQEEKQQTLDATSFASRAPHSRPGQPVFSRSHGVFLFFASRWYHCMKPGCAVKALLPDSKRIFFSSPC